MNRKIKHIHLIIFSTILGLIIFVGCSTQSDAWPNRMYHQLNTKYNGLFYAEQYLAQGIEKIEKSHKDDYAEVLKINKLGARIITPVFKDFKNGQLKIISFFAKKARGRMCRFIIKNKLTSSNALRKFKDDGYAFDKKLSTDSEFVFIR